MRIFVTSGYGYWGKFLPTDLRDPQCTHQVGGGETAMVSMSRELAARGHEVFVFYDVAEPGQYEGVEYLPTKMFQTLACTLNHDVLISWDSVLALRLADRALVHILAFQLNDAQIGVFDHAVDRYFHPSRWHSSRFKELYPEISTKKQRSHLTNGLDMVRYTQDVERQAGRVIYSSSPDRGLHHLLRFWPLVKERVPDAELHVFYDIDKWAALTFDLESKGYVMQTGSRAHTIKDFQATNDPSVSGVHFRGGVGQWELAREQLKSEVMVYPCDPVQPTEGFSMSCLEGIGAGCNLVVSNADALGELWTDAPNTTILPLPVDDEVWADAVVSALAPIPARKPLVPVDYAWSQLALLWETEILDCVREKTT